jgi:hypothetical protein
MKKFPLVVTHLCLVLVLASTSAQPCIHACCALSEVDFSLRSLPPSGGQQRARMTFYDFETSNIALGDTCSIGLKILTSIDSVDSALVIVTGFPGLFTFQELPQCSNGMTAFLGDTATGFWAASTSAVTAGQGAIVRFVVTLKPGRSLNDVLADVYSGTSAPMPEAPLAGSPIIGASRAQSGSFGSVQAAPAFTSCLDGVDDVKYPSRFVWIEQGVYKFPTLSQAGLITVVTLLLAAGVVIILRRRAAAVRA